MKKHKRINKKRKLNISGFLSTLLIILVLVFLVLKTMTSALDGLFEKKTSDFIIETSPAPIGLWANAISETEIDIGWSNEIPMDFYYIYYAYDESGFWDTVRDSNDDKLKFTWSKDIIYKFENLTPGTKLYFKIQGISDGIKSAYSDHIFSETYSGIKTTLMLKPDFSRYTKEDLEIIKPQEIILTFESEKENQISDTDVWFKDNELELNEYKLFEGNSDQSDLPLFVSKKYNNQTLLKAIKDKKHIILIYGKEQHKGSLLLILDKDTGERLYSLDFKDYAYAPSYDITRTDEVFQGLRWAQIEDDILYVSNAQDSYSKYSNYNTSFITAIDLKNLEILWRTTRLVSNSYNFTIYNDIIITGYGFTYEDDFLYLINKHSGGYYEKIKIHTASTYLIAKADKLYVRAYNSDYVFTITNKN